MTCFRAPSPETPDDGEPGDLRRTGTGGGSVLVGTAGWSIPRTAMDAFPSTGSHLERYAAVFPAVEINSSFHRPHRRSTYERWAASVPPAFRFSVKMPKEISHKTRLVDCGALIEAFLSQVGGLGGKLSVLLLQLPPSFAFEEKVASSFFALLRLMLDPAIDVVCEPRNATWFAEDADRCLFGYKVARVVADPVLVAGGDRPGGWPGMTYRRLHGSPRIYYSPYPASSILDVAGAIAEERGERGVDLVHLRQYRLRRRDRRCGRFAIGARGVGCSRGSPGCW